jgi:hypothetical protein
LSLGCNGGDGLVPVGGVVSLDGEPLGGASVMFHHESGQTAYGLSDANGRFRLTTREANDGALVGRHRVTVTLAVVEGGVAANADGVEDYTQPVRPEKIRRIVPAAYGDLQSPRLTVEVDSDGDEFTLPLDSKLR